MTYVVSTGRTHQVAVSRLIPLPQEDSSNYYSYEVGTRQFGTRATITAIVEVAKAFHAKRPNLSIGIGDISLAAGGTLRPHASHKDGRNVDVRPLRKDGKRLGVTIQEPGYSREDTRVLVEVLLGHGNVRSVLFNDSQIKGVIHWAGHDNHLHVNMRE